MWPSPLCQPGVHQHHKLLDNFPGSSPETTGDSLFQYEEQLTFAPSPSCSDPCSTEPTTQSFQNAPPNFLTWFSGFKLLGGEPTYRCPILPHQLDAGSEHHIQFSDFISRGRAPPLVPNCHSFTQSLTKYLLSTQDLTSMSLGAGETAVSEADSPAATEDHSHCLSVLFIYLPASGSKPAFSLSSRVGCAPRRDSR